MADNRLAAIQMAFGAFGGAFNSLNSMITAAGQQQRIDMQTQALIAQQDAQELRTTLQNEAAADILLGRGETRSANSTGSIGAPPLRFVASATAWTWPPAGPPRSSTGPRRVLTSAP